MSDAGSFHFQGRKRPLEGGEEQERPRKQWRGPLSSGFPVPLAETAVVEQESGPQPVAEGIEGLTRPRVGPAKEEGEGEEEFWVAGMGRRFPVNQDFDWQSPDLQGEEEEEEMDCEDWFSGSQLQQVHLGEQEPTAATGRQG